MVSEIFKQWERTIFALGIMTTRFLKLSFSSKWFEYLRTRQFQKSTSLLEEVTFELYLEEWGFLWQRMTRSLYYLREDMKGMWKWKDVGGTRWYYGGRKESDTTERPHFHFSLSCTGEGNGNPLQCSCLENPRGGGAWWAAVYGVTQSQTWLKWLSSLAAASRKIDLWKYSYLDNLWKSSLYLQDNACRHPCLLVTPHLARWLETRKVCWIPPRGSP